MNLFQKHPEDYDNNFENYPIYDLQGVSITTPYFRIKTWEDFLNEQAKYHHCEIQPIFRIFEELSNNMIFRTQTAHELELSFEFFRKLFNKKGGIYIKSNVVAHKLMVFSLIYSRYYGFAVSSLSVAISELSNFPSPIEIHLLFKKVFVKYQYPRFIIENFEYLENHEVHILMSALAGKNMKNHPIFHGKLTSRDFSNIMTFNITNSYTKSFFERASAHVLMKKVEVASCEVERFILNSKIYLGDPSLFLKSIEFWQRGYQLASSSLHLYHIDVFYFIDYFDILSSSDNPIIKLKKRTPQSLLRQVMAWHREIAALNNEQLRNLSWENQENLPDIEFRVERYYYQCKQLKSGVEVCEEGSAQKHCVNTYITSCAQGVCRIWSLRKKTGQTYEPWITIQEVNKTVVQAKLKMNEHPNEYDLNVLEIWAKKIGFRVAELK